MARHVGEFRAGAEEPLSLPELVRMLGGGEPGEQNRADAIACYLSGGDGWRDAAKLLDGTFAETARVKDA